MMMMMCNEGRRTEERREIEGRREKREGEAAQLHKFSKVGARGREGMHGGDVMM